MARPPYFRAVYKTIGSQEIDTRIYLPSSPPRGKTIYPVIINVHGGAFMLGSAGIVNQDQVQDCLGRGWIVVVPNHRLCPQVNLLEGPMQDCRDLLSWIQDGGLEKSIYNESQAMYKINPSHIFAFGTSSGGHLALSLGYDVPRPVAGIFDMYGACCFSDPFWTSELPRIKDRLPPGLTTDFINQVFLEEPVPTQDGASLEGQAPGPPNFKDPRVAFAFTQIATGNVLNTIFPSKNWKKVDPLENITKDFPPTFIVHGQSDTMVPIVLSRKLYSALQNCGVKCGMREVPGEEHTFAGSMKVGSATWDLQREGFDFLEGLMCQA
ncbi:alpha/beta-hydrolase [Thozetella sp. PMI_491]|nr:alpha/beta-hydrolase [Thozetella sp. PMI_491]